MSVSREIEEALFEAAMVIESPAARSAFVELVRRGDSAQSERLGNLLEAQAEADRFYRKAECSRTMVAVEAGGELVAQEGATLADDASAGEEPGTRIGRYRLVRRIGEGGCGVVYLAEQQEPVKRNVALKVIRLGMDTERVIARFEIERQSLAMMDHPNIARVLDAGATENGRPFFVMEWVRGLRITEYCDENRLDVRQRIDLFIDVCKAIQHAHQKGVIHRDIKPSNILVSMENGRAEPKVIDFGVAKAIAQEDGSKTALTFNDHFVGTPAYMSPEQADETNEDIDTRSDVYSLGIVLYELLAGKSPFDPAELAAVGMLETRKILAEREQALPSAILASMPPPALEKAGFCRHVDSYKLIALLREDLDSVIMKAIEKDRRRRYETVNALTMDLQRYLAHEPVLARPQSRLYLFTKFVRRNRLVVGAATVVAASLVVGMGIASAFYLRERSARQEQARLGALAENAHRGELVRLNEARQWESFAEISMLLSAGKITEADEKLRETPLSSIRLSPGSADVVRSLANWNALRGRWPQASECFIKLMDADSMSSKDPMTTSADSMAMGPVLVLSGNRDGYNHFRKWALTRGGRGESLLWSARVLHSTLLAPADADFLARLNPLKAELEASEFNEAKLRKGWPRDSASWRAFTLSLLEYRRGDYAQSQVWAERSLKLHAYSGCLSSTTQAVLGMSFFRKGKVDEARAQLAEARTRIEAAFAPDLPAAYEPFGPNKGFWWDWIIARILFQEAEAVVGVGE